MEALTQIGLFVELTGVALLAWDLLRDPAPRDDAEPMPIHVLLNKLIVRLEQDADFDLRYDLKQLRQELMEEGLGATASTVADEASQLNLRAKGELGLVLIALACFAQAIGAMGGA